MRLRIDKMLSEMTSGSRGEVKKWIRQGRVYVNGCCTTKPEYKVDVQSDEVVLDGETITYQQYEYYMLNKPAGYVCATRDNLHPVVTDLIRDSKRNDLFPVGRLDIDTVGLLLITNDGELSHCLLSPKKHVDKLYRATIQGILETEDVRRLEEGMDIGDDTKTLPARVEAYQVLSENKTQVDLVIHEGRYHQVKRMFGALNKPVLTLERLKMGKVSLDPGLKRGQYRALTTKEISSLFD